MDPEDRNGQDQLGRSRLGQGYTGDQASIGGLIGGSGAQQGDSGQVATGEGPDTIDLSPRFRPWSEPSQGSGVPLQCHFLRTVTPDGRLAEAQGTAVPTHRCAAFGDPLPLSLRQQELVCLQRVHVSCPRYVRGTLLASEAEAKPADEERKSRFPLMTVIAIGLVVLGVLVLGTNGLGFFAGGSKQAATPSSNIALVSPTATPSATVTAAPTASPTTAPTATATATVKPTATPAATTAPTPTPKPTTAPTATPKASPTWPPGATASRMNLLTPCTDQPNCWLYTVRSAAQNGSKVDDAVPGIAKWFGVSQSAIIELNPWAANGITPGQQLKLPPPTR